MDESFIIFKRAVQSEKYGTAESGNYGHAGIPGQVGGSAPSENIVGITSARGSTISKPGESLPINMERMSRFENTLKKFDGVKDVKIYSSRGIFTGGGENTWVVSYKGNGQARKFLAETGDKYNQDAVFKYTLSDKETENSSPIDELKFDKYNPDEKERPYIEKLMAKVGLGGGTWVHDASKDSKESLRLSHVPWYGTAKEHTDKVNALNDLLEQYLGKDSISRTTKHANFEGFEHNIRGEGKGIKYKDVK
jgi:hypothetical protein